ncbi:hypothetical protein [Mucilaginibacter celer]|uniref:Uncharacterized protein n=1 Tax=Mucilaginibacter celer TaxID=2305508 RepID=A0A494VS11_9SPHI|nr:hypothetical protein [Mucilaginibacter celer]AYL96831.1 hypothetical protein HYN43_016655 [Mucilaginibacter celer]
MKWLISGIIIGTGIMTGGFFLLINLLNTPPITLFVTWLLLSIWVAILIGLGYLFIYLLGRKRLYNMHIAILVPWLWMPLILFTPLFIHVENPVSIAVEIPAILVLLSIGGAWAHHHRLQKVAL